MLRIEVITLPPRAGDCPGADTHQRLIDKADMHMAVTFGGNLVAYVNRGAHLYAAATRAWALQIGLAQHQTNFTHRSSTEQQKNRRQCLRALQPG